MGRIRRVVDFVAVCTQKVYEHISFGNCYKIVRRNTHDSIQILYDAHGSEGIPAWYVHVELVLYGSESRDPFMFPTSLSGIAAVLGAVIPSG